MKEPKERYSAEWWRWYRKKHGKKLRAYRRKYDRERYKIFPEQERARRYKWKENNKEKVKCHKIVYKAKKSGKIKKGLCEICQSEKTVAHHKNYSKPLEIRWFCQKHHLEHHKSL